MSNLDVQPESYVIGSAPFCGAKPEECPKELGYVPEIVTNSGCWTGNKYKCTFSRDQFKTTELYKELSASEQFKKSGEVLKYHAFGTAPRT